MLTRKRKILGEGIRRLASWARSNGVAIRLCTHCIREEFVDEDDLKTSTQAASLAGSNYSRLTAALEGQIREATTLQYGRNNALRTSALLRAKGTCEGCLVNFSKVAGGLGKNALQVHHKHPLSQREQPSIRSIDELTVLCANCHCIVNSNMITL